MSASSAQVTPRVEQAEAFGRVAVIYGGLSAERDVSLQSGQAVLDGLRRGGVDAHGVDVDKHIAQRLQDGRFDRVFNALHGRGGEDGTIQGLLQMLGIPFTGSGVLGSALAMDKNRTKLLWRGIGLPTPPWQRIHGEAELETVAEALGYPLIVKPVHEGSSIGMTKVADGEELLSAWWLAANYDSDIMVERWIEGAEYTVALLAGEALPVIRLETPRTFYDYEAKYEDGMGTLYHCPCGLEHAREMHLRELSLTAFESVGGSGWGRVDLLCDEAGDPWLIEVNTSPGMTSHSLVPMAAKAAGMSFEQLVWRILETTLS
jgi:D-alanine-D-alanine ligase